MSEKTLAQRYWKRVGRIEIEGMPKIEDGLDFKFSIEKAGFYTRFTCGILGLNAQHIKALTVWNSNIALAQARKIKVYAGYGDDTGARMLVQGYVFSAMPTSPPEMWMNFTCNRYMQTKKPVIPECTVEDATLKEIFAKICQYTGDQCGEWKSKAVNGETKDKFEFSGSVDELLSRFQTQFGVVVSEDNGLLTVTDQHANIHTSPPAGCRTIDIDHGLLACGNIDNAGATVRVRLDNAYNINEWVKLDSILIPSASGYYFIIDKKHVGHLRGNDWYTELTMRRYYGG